MERESLGCTARCTAGGGGNRDGHGSGSHGLRGRSRDRGWLRSGCLRGGGGASR